MQIYLKILHSDAGKVNVTPGAEQRILSSLNQQPAATEDRVETNHETAGSPRSDFTDMPNVAKALNKAAHMNDESDVTDRGGETTDGGAQEDVHNMDNKSTASTLTTSSTPRKVETTNLHSISGPLGLLDRANPLEPRYNADLMNNLLRYSAGDDASILDTSLNMDSKMMDMAGTDSGIGSSKRTSYNTVSSGDNIDNINTTVSSSGDNIDNNNTTQMDRLNISTDDDGEVSMTSSIRTTTSSSLLDMVASSRLKVRPLTAGFGSMVGLDTAGSADVGGMNEVGGLREDADLSLELDGVDLDVDDKTRTDETSTGGTGRKKEAGLFGYLTSFLS